MRLDLEGIFVSEREKVPPPSATAVSDDDPCCVKLLYVVTSEGSSWRGLAAFGARRF